MHKRTPFFMLALGAVIVIGLTSPAMAQTNRGAITGSGRVTASESDEGKSCVRVFMRGVSRLVSAGRTRLYRTSRA